MDISDPEDIVETVINFCKFIKEGITLEEFKKYDKDSSGYLSRKELNKPAKDILNGFNEDLSKQEKVAIIDEWFIKYDLNKDGKISYDEFKNMLESIFAKLVMDELRKIQKEPACPKDLKELDLLKYLNCMLSSLPKEDQVLVQKFIENAKKEF